MYDLLTTTNRVIPGRKPHGNPVRDGAREMQEVTDQEPGGQQTKPGRCKERTAASHRIQSKKHAGDHQRWSKILLEKEKEQRESSCQQHRHYILEPRQIDVTRELCQFRAAFFQNP